MSNTIRSASEAPAGTWFEQARPFEHPEFMWVRIPNSDNYIRFNRDTQEATVRDSSRVNFWAPFKTTEETR